MLKEIEFKDILFPKSYSLNDIIKVKPSPITNIKDTAHKLEYILENDAVIQYFTTENVFYEDNFGTTLIFSKLKDGFKGYCAEDLAYLYKKVSYIYVKSKDLIHLQLEDGLTVLGKKIFNDMLKNNRINNVLISLYSGKYTNDIHKKSYYEYIPEITTEIKCEFIDRLFQDRGFRYQGSFCIPSRSIEELNNNIILDSISKYVCHLYLMVYKNSYDSDGNYYKRLIWN